LMAQGPMAFLNSRARKYVGVSMSCITKCACNARLHNEITTHS
jgi:hypothetical protein